MPALNIAVQEEASAYIERTVLPTLLPAIEKMLAKVKKGEEVLDPIGIIAYQIAKQNPNPYCSVPGRRSKYLETVIARVEDRMLARSTSMSSTRTGFSRTRGSIPSSSSSLSMNGKPSKTGSFGSVGHTHLVQSATTTSLAIDGI
eukprot:jgi/Hompol1/3572/HPOL_003291-RA